MRSSEQLTESVIIRAYRNGDRDAIRQICCDTADRGQGVESFFSDREVFADLLTSYYTDYEPQSLLVVDSEGRAVGYLSGCINERRYIWVMSCHIIPNVVIRAIGRGLLFSRQAWVLLMAGLRTWAHGIMRMRRAVSLKRYPAHLHLNLQASFRGQGIGSRLVTKFLELAKGKNAQGVHVAVREDNVNSCRLFQGLGFVEIKRTRVVWPSNGSYGTHDTLVYGKTL